MATFEPIPDHPAAIAEIPGERLLVIADYHAGFEAAARIEDGIELRSRGQARREHLLGLVDRFDPDRVLVLGDLTHSIGEPGGAERAELEVLVDHLDRPLIVAKGNHDGVLEDVLGTDPALYGAVSVLPPTGDRIGPLGVAHGHTWPDPDVLTGEVFCIGHEHPCVRLSDEVGGRRIERVWLRGDLEAAPFDERTGNQLETSAELIVVPAFNDLCGGTWVNVDGQEFLAPFLPRAMPRGHAYLLDGTNLGRYDAV